MAGRGISEIFPLILLRAEVSFHLIIWILKGCPLSKLLLKTTLVVWAVLQSRFKKVRDDRNKIHADVPFGSHIVWADHTILHFDAIPKGNFSHLDRKIH